MYGQFYTAAMQMQQWQAAESHHLFPATVVRDKPDLANCQRWVPPREERGVSLQRRGVFSEGPGKGAHSACLADIWGGACPLPCCGCVDCHMTHG